MTSPLIWHRTTELLVQWSVSPKDASGNVASISGVDVALLPYRSRGPTASTVWKAATYVAGVGALPGSAKIMVAGPDAADPGSAGFRFATADYGGDLWARVIASSEVEPEFVTRIDLIQD